MALQRRFKVAHGDVFPMGAFMKGSVEPVLDFGPSARRQDGSRPQQLDKDSGLPLWQVTVLDADEDAGRRDTAVSVKIAAQYQPVPPDNSTGTPWRPVEFIGLSVLPYIDDSGQRPRIAWSLRAEDLVAPGEARKTSGPKAVAS
jgi:hypothetical protein